MTDTKALKNHFYLSVLFFFLAILTLVYIVFPIFLALSGHGAWFFGLRDEGESMAFLIHLGPPIILFFVFLVLMNVFFKKSGYGSEVAFIWWLPIATCSSLIIVALVASFFFMIFMLSVINLMVVLPGFLILMTNAIGLSVKGAKKRIPAPQNEKGDGHGQ